MSDQEFEKTEIMALLEEMEPSERLDVFQEISRTFCLACGEDAPCHCQNDE